MKISNNHKNVIEFMDNHQSIYSTASIKTQTIYAGLLIHYIYIYIVYKYSIIQVCLPSIQTPVHMLSNTPIV